MWGLCSSGAVLCPLAARRSPSCRISWRSNFWVGFSCRKSFVKLCSSFAQASLTNEEHALPSAPTELPPQKFFRTRNPSSRTFYPIYAVESSLQPSPIFQRKIGAIYTCILPQAPISLCEIGEIYIDIPPQVPPLKKEGM